MAVGDSRAALTELRQLIETEAAAFPALEAVWEALRTRGKLLSPGGGFAWGDLALVACDVARAGGDAGPALAAATECLMAALDIIDDIQDADAPDALYRSWGIPTALNAALLLLFLSQLEMNALSERGVAASRVSAAAHTLAAAAASACSGQQEDIEGPPGGRGSEEQYLAMIARKSAALVQGVCRAAAILGGIDAGDTACLADFGFNVGMAMQILNDVAGASTERADRNDLGVGKVTLSVIFAREFGGLPPGMKQDADGTVGKRPLDVIEVGQISEFLESSGALEYARTVADLYWERAVTCAKDLHAGTGQLTQLISELRGDVEIGVMP